MATSFLYSMTEKGQEKQYPSWKDGKPNLQTYLDALNKSQPIVQCQYELVWSRWPRTLFFAKNVTIPGVSVHTVDINHAGFTISIPTHSTYEGTEISMQILADKEGYHYYDIRNMVLQTGHPFVAGDTRSTIGNPFKISPDEDTLEVRLRNSPEDQIHHHWIIHNFRPIKIGDIELSMDSSSFVEFELTGTFTHISYDCGHGAVDPQPEKKDTKRDIQEYQNKDPEESPSSESGESNGGDQNGEQGDSGKDNSDQGENLPEDWEYMSETDKKAYNMMKDGMSAEEAQNAIKEELKQSDPSLSEDDLEAQAQTAVQNATAAQNTQENTPAPPNNVDTKLSESEQNQFKQEFSNSQPAQPETPAPQPEQPSQPQPEQPTPQPEQPTPQPEQPSQPQPEQPSPQPEQPSQPEPEQPSQPEPQTWTKIQIAGEDFDGKSLSKKQMGVMELGMAMGNSYPPEIMAVYNAQKGKK